MCFIEGYDIAFWHRERRGQLRDFFFFKQKERLKESDLTECGQD